MRYTYWAKRPDGTDVNKTVEASSVGVLVGALRQEGLVLLSIEEATEMPEESEHVCTWGNIALEDTDSNGTAEVWQWCIRCGKLKLGAEIFTPGTHQDKTFVSD